MKRRTKRNVLIVTVALLVIAGISTPAVALVDQYQGPSLGETWLTHDRRSAFVGTFAVGAAQAAEHHASSGE